MDAITTHHQLLICLKCSAKLNVERPTKKIRFPSTFIRMEVSKTSNDIFFGRFERAMGRAIGVFNTEYSLVPQTRNYQLMVTYYRLQLLNTTENGVSSLGSSTHTDTQTQVFRNTGNYSAIRKMFNIYVKSTINTTFGRRKM